MTQRNLPVYEIRYHYFITFIRSEFRYHYFITFIHSEYHRKIVLFTTPHQNIIVDSEGVCGSIKHMQSRE